VTLHQRPSWGLWLTLCLTAHGCRNPPESRHGRAVVLAPAQLDLGVLIQNETTTGMVKLRNSAALAVRLRFGSTARCRWQAFPEALEPGLAVPVTVACRSDLLGPLAEALTVTNAASGEEVTTLRIVARVEPVIGFDTAFVDLRPEFGQTTAVDIHLVGKRAAQATPTVSSTSDDILTIAPLRTTVPGFRVSCDGKRVGMHAGSLVVSTGIAEHPTLTLSWGCRVPSTLEVEPSTPYFNLRRSGERAQTILVRSSHPGFAVKSARVLEGPFRATVEKPNPDGSTPITIRVKNGEISDEARAATGRLMIESNDPREPRKELPLFGLGKVNKTAQPDRR
jgi:hypothetical protein